MTGIPRINVWYCILPPTSNAL